jgi:hypothetical protein
MPPQCVLFEPNDKIDCSFPELVPDIIPIFPSTGIVTIQNMSVIRSQIPITPAWAMTDYKIQGSTCDAVTLDLHRQNSDFLGEPSQTVYCSIYVQLTRVETLDRLFLLRPVTLNDLNCKPHKLLQLEDERIAALDKTTDLAWKHIEATSEFLRKDYSIIT